MTTLLLTHPAFLRHDTGPLHPERPARMRAIDAALSEGAFARLWREEAPLREDAEAAILRAHDREHLERLRALSADRDRLPASIDGDTVVSAGTWEAALRAVGAGLRAVDAVMDPVSGVGNAFCQVRPPGHHAGRNRAMGFCFFSTTAIAALYARAQYRARRVAVVDFDVHHGNGTQEIFWADPDLFSTAPRTRCRCSLAPARPPSAASATFGTRRCARGTAARRSVGLSRGASCPPWTVSARTT